MSIPVTDKNRLSIKYPIIASEWDFNKNIDCPNDISYASHKKRWFNCTKCLFSYFTSIASRTNRKSGCPKCCFQDRAERRLNPKFGESLEEKYPELIEEWSINNTKSPKDYKYGSESKVNWICRKCKHEWKSTINKRTSGRGCPRCKFSQGEKKIEEILQIFNINYISQYRIVECKNKRPLPFDFAIFKDSILVGLIEYNGEQHYRECNKIWSRYRDLKYRQNNDKIKVGYCRDHTIPLLVIPFTAYKSIEILLEDFIKRVTI